MPRIRPDEAATAANGHQADALLPVCGVPLSAATPDQMRAAAKWYSARAAVFVARAQELTRMAKAAGRARKAAEAN